MKIWLGWVAVWWLVWLFINGWVEGWNRRPNIVMITVLSIICATAVWAFVY